MYIFHAVSMIFALFTFYFEVSYMWILLLFHFVVSLFIYKYFFIWFLVAVCSINDGMNIKSEMAFVMRGGVLSGCFGMFVTPFLLSDMKIGINYYSSLQIGNMTLFAFYMTICILIFFYSRRKKICITGRDKKLIVYKYIKTVWHRCCLFGCFLFFLGILGALVFVVAKLPSIVAQQEDLSFLLLGQNESVFAQLGLHIPLLFIYVILLMIFFLPRIFLEGRKNG